MRLFTLSILFSCLNVFSQGEYQSLFWEISGNGLKDTSYLYGTMHSQDSRIFQFKDGVEAAFNNSDIYAMELNIDSIDEPNNLSRIDDFKMESIGLLFSFGVGYGGKKTLGDIAYSSMLKNNYIDAYSDAIIHYNLFKEKYPKDELIPSVEYELDILKGILSKIDSLNSIVSKKTNI